jgi:hypothetical protein
MEKINAHQRYRDNLAEDIKSIPKDSEVLVDGEVKNEREVLLNSEKGSVRYEKAYEIHRNQIKEYCVERINEKIEELELEKERLNKIKKGYLEELDGSELVIESDGEVKTDRGEEVEHSGEIEAMESDLVSTLEVERDLDQPEVMGCVLEEPVSKGEIDFVLASKTLDEFKSRFKNFIDELFTRNKLNNTSFSRKLSPEQDEEYHKTFRTVVSRTISGDRPISINSSLQRNIFKGLGLEISEFAAKVEALEIKEKLDYDINEDFFDSNRVILNEFVESLTEDDDINFSKLLSLLHEMDNRNMKVTPLEGCVLRIKPTKEQILKVLATKTLDDFNNSLSQLVKNLLEESNITATIFGEETGVDPALVRGVRLGIRPISTKATQHHMIFKGLGLDIRIFESRQRKLINDEKHGIKALENFRYSGVDIKPYIHILSESFTDVSIGDLIRVAHFIDNNFVMIEKNKNVFAEIVHNEFPELVRSK